MDKQKQIEEIKKYMRYFCVTETVLKYCRYEVEKEIEKQKEVYATAIYNAGYRKIDENTVVIPKEEYEKLRYLADECLNWRRKYCNTNEVTEGKV